MSTAKVLLHNSAQKCAKATETTLKALPGGACQGFTRNASGEIVVRDGWVEAETANPRFLEFAILNQGYAKGLRQ